MNIKTPPMPKPEGTFLVLGRNEAWNEETGQYTAEQITDRDAQWLEMVRPMVEALHRIQGYSMSQFASHADLASQCIKDASEALRNITED